MGKKKDAEEIFSFNFSYRRDYILERPNSTIQSDNFPVRTVYIPRMNLSVRFVKMPVDWRTILIIIAYALLIWMKDSMSKTISAKTERDSRLSDKPSSTRIIIDLDEDSALSLEKIRKQLKLGRRVEVLRYALGLLQLYSEHISQGYELLLRKDNESIRIAIPHLR